MQLTIKFERHPDCRHAIGTSYANRCDKCKEFRKKYMIDHGVCALDECQFAPNQYNQHKNEPEKILQQKIEDYTLLFNEVREKIDFFHAISRYVEIKQFYATCPLMFNGEKCDDNTVFNLHISLTSNQIKCKKCKFQGDIISFIANLKMMNQIEAAMFILDEFKS